MGRDRFLTNRPAARAIACVAAAIATLALAGCQKSAAQAEPPPPTVGVVESRRMTRAGPGHAERDDPALEDVTIRARVRGFLTERHFEEGSLVKKGQLLLVIDEEPYKVALQIGQGQPGRGRGRAREGRGVEGVARSRRPSSSSTGRSCCSPSSRSGGAGRSCPATPPSAEETGQGRGRPQEVARPRSRPTSPTSRRPRSDYDVGIASAAAQARGRQGRGPRRRAEPGLLPDVRPDRRPDRRGQGQGRQPRRARAGRRRAVLRAGHHPAARPDGRRHPAQLARPRSGHRADRGRAWPSA